MALPILINGPWRFDLGNDCSEAAYEDTARHAAWGVKEALISFSEWSVVASCDGSSVKNIGDGSPDLWIVWTNVTGGTGAHSWAILENSVTGEQLAIDLNKANEYQINWAYSATGAYNADGTTTALPTSSEYVWIQQNSYGWITTSTVGAIVNAMISNDGKCTRVYVHLRSGASEGGFFFGMEELVGTPSQWISTHKRALLRHQWHVYVTTTPSTQSPRLTEYDATTAKCVMYLKDVTPYEGWDFAFYTAELYHQWSTNQGNAPFYYCANNLEWAEGYAVQPIGLFRNINPRGGGMGAFQDLYWAYKDHLTQSTYPSGGAKTWVKFGCFFVPWDGSTPVNVP